MAKRSKKPTTAKSKSSPSTSPRRVGEKVEASQIKRDIPDHDGQWQNAGWRGRVRRQLLAWFDQNAREMPWRRHPEPYHVWVSEIMLQQTQVATVLPYFDRFLASFPTIADLAAADESTLMAHWEGLGYYRRARSLHAAAKLIVDQHDGIFPTRLEDVLALPGIGRYTAGAILSISGDQKLPILEGNTQRVFSRWIALRQSPLQKSANTLLWTVAEKMLPPTGSGRFNQAAMELGALICTPRQPNCQQCPVKRSCAAQRENLQDEIPGKVSKTKYEDRTEFALVIAKATGKRDNDDPHYLMRPLPEGSRWAGLWDFPRPTETAYESVTSAGDWLSDELGVSVQTGIRLKTIRHAVTKYRISLQVHVASVTKSRKKLPAPWQYVTLREMAQLPMSVTARQITEFLQSDPQRKLPL
ncbi:MAG: A/G-specific adenine glycosylase [Pirellulaceae bacterium]|nr:A/G-specific adenine glycosylase [Pirellulaceae bacterium]